MGLDSDLLTYGSAEMSGFGAELERTGLGPHALPKNVRRFSAIALWREKSGQVLVRTANRKNARDSNRGNRLYQEV
jgi:hypothetical protein